jgi:hypothetical protein
LSEGGAGGRLYLEGLATLLTVHLLRGYSSSKPSPLPHRGGLASRQMRRVLDYIEAHPTDELGLVELATIAGLSSHHFGQAFKTSVGKDAAPVCHGKAGSACNEAPAERRTLNRSDRACYGVLKPEPAHGEFPQGDGNDTGPFPTIARLRDTGLSRLFPNLWARKKAGSGKLPEAYRDLFSVGGR